jgi:hypothetical protein
MRSPHEEFAADSERVDGELAARVKETASLQGLPARNATRPCGYTEGGKQQ